MRPPISSIDFEQRFDRLLQAVIDGRVVPFVGAGFSSTAKSRICEEFEPRVSYLNGLLKRFIEKKITSELEDEHPAYESVKKLFHEASKCDSLGQLAEIAQWLSPNPKMVLDAICVDLLGTLYPTDSHRYLAYLVREGLINEVITTNYDTCMETAYRRSFGQSCDSQCRRHDNTPGNHCGEGHDDGCEYARDQKCITFRVIHNLREYRKHGARLFDACSRRHPVLRIYKINGCANEHSHCLCKSMAESPGRILLTERELQNFGREAWARDLLRDRARSRSLLFIGFGSQEPQIRHTVLALMEEFHSATDSRSTIAKNEEILLWQNAPFLVAFSSTLSFPQLQILAGFVQAHRAQNNPRGFLETCFGNVFTGSDLASFNLDGGERVLRADDFMRRLFQAVYGRLLECYSAMGSLFFKWLERHTEIPATWRAMLINSLYPKQNGAARFFGRWPQLLEPDEEKGRFGPCLLWDWLNSIQRDAVQSDSLSLPLDYYLAFDDDSLLILAFLTILSALACKESLKLQKAPGVGMAIRCDALGGRPVFVAHERRQVRLKDFARVESTWVLSAKGKPAITRETSTSIEPLPGVLFILDLPSATYLESEGRVYEEKTKAADRVKSIRGISYIRVPASDWIHAARSPEDMGKESLDKAFKDSISRKRDQPVRMTRLS